MERAKQLLTKVECTKCGRYGVQGFKPGPDRTIVCAAEKACAARAKKRAKS